MKKKLENMSSQDLYELAQRREVEEQEQERERIEAQVKELREERKVIPARHCKELRQIDAKIRALVGSTKTEGKRRRRTSRSAAVVEIVANAEGLVTTGDIRFQLEKRGVSGDNIAQTLANLKRQGKIVSAGRGLYLPA